MAISDPQRLTELLTRLREGWPGSPWEWDGRFGCALATVSGSGQHAQARALLTAELPEVWTTARLAEAPSLVRQVCSMTGGLRGSQLVFSADLGDAVAFCLWWPWGGEVEISARIAATGADGLAAVVRTAFGIK